MPNSKPVVGITFSTFDLLHAGHVAMLRDAKEQCDYLICGLQVDPSKDRAEKNSPVQTLVERWTQIQAVRYIDEIVPYQDEKDVEDILNMFNIDIRIIGEEYKDMNFTGRTTCTQRGISIYYNKRDHRFSSSGLRERVYNIEKGKEND